MIDSISMIADEIMRQVLYGATVDWRPNMAQIAQRLRKIASLRQVPERWSARYFASGPQGEFFTPIREFAEALIAGMKYDRDDWTITDLSIGDTCRHSPDIDWQALYRFQTAMRYMDNNPKMTLSNAQKMADEDIEGLKLQANPAPPTSVACECMTPSACKAHECCIAATPAQAGAELPEFFGPDDAGCYYVKTNRGWFYARPQERLTPEQLAELARLGGSDG